MSTSFLNLGTTANHYKYVLAALATSCDVARNALPLSDDSSRTLEPVSRLFGELQICYQAAQKNLEGKVDFQQQLSSEQERAQNLVLGLVSPSPEQCNQPQTALKGLVNPGKNNSAFTSELQLILHAAPLREALMDVPQYHELRQVCGQYYGKVPGTPDPQQIRAMLHRDHPTLIGMFGTYQDASELLSLMIGKVPADVAKRLFPTYKEIKKYAATGVTQPIGHRALGNRHSRLDGDNCATRTADPTPALSLDIRPPADPRDPLGRIRLAEGNFAEMLANALENQSVEMDSHALFLGPDPTLLYQYRQICERKTYAQMPQHLVITLRRFDAHGNKLETPAQVPRVLHLPATAAPDMVDRRLILKAFIVHIDGYHISYVNIGNQWHQCEDSTLKPMPLEEVDEALRTSYIHYFERGNADAEPPMSQNRRTQLETLLSRCNDDRADNGELLRLFNELPNRVKNELYTRVWETQGNKRNEWGLGEKLLRENPRVLIRNRPNINLLLEALKALPIPVNPSSSAQAEIALELSEALTRRHGTEQDWQKIFKRLDPHWRGRSMYWIWEARNKPDELNFGEKEITRSLLCLTEKVGTAPNAKRVIDHVIDELLEAAKKAPPVAVKRKPYTPPPSTTTQFNAADLPYISPAARSALNSNKILGAFHF